MLNIDWINKSTNEYVYEKLFLINEITKLNKNYQISKGKSSTLGSSSMVKTVEENGCNAGLISMYTFLAVCISELMIPNSCLIDIPSNNKKIYYYNIL